MQVQLYEKACEGGCGGVKTYQNQKQFNRSKWTCSSCVWGKSKINKCSSCDALISPRADKCLKCSAVSKLTVLNDSIKKGIVKHGRVGRLLTDSHKNAVSKAHKGKFLGDENVSKRADVREKISKALSEKHYLKGKTLEEYFGEDKAEELKRMHREVTSGQRPKGNQKKQFYNKRSIKVIEDFGRVHGYNFQHAENGGEFPVLGYWLDGYDKEKNVVIEFYERAHYNIDGTLKQRDIEREFRIIKHLNCTYIRINAFSKKNIKYEEVA